jgi:hypothetical protein
VAALEKERAATDNRERGNRATIAALEARVYILEQAATTCSKSPPEPPRLQV